MNADEIAKGLSPFQPEKVSFEAGRIMLHRIKELLDGNESFAFETTLSYKSYKPKVLAAKKRGFTVTLLFFWLNNPKLAKERVKIRVEEGGRNIPNEIIERRYYKGIKNLFDIYLDIVDGILIFDNSFGKHELIAQKIAKETILIYDQKRFDQIRKYYDK